MGTLFILNRLMMEELNKDAYQTIDRSRLFKLCDSMDETETSIHYGSSSFPLQSIREAPHARIYQGSESCSRPFGFVGRINDDSELHGCLEALRYLTRSQDIID